MAKAIVTGTLGTGGGDAPAFGSAWITVAVVNPTFAVSGVALLPYCPPIPVAADGTWTASLEPLPLGGAYALKAVVGNGQEGWERTVLVPTAGTFVDKDLQDAEVVGGSSYGAPAWIAALSAATTSAAARAEDAADRAEAPTEAMVTNLLTNPGPVKTSLNNTIGTLTDSKFVPGNLPTWAVTAGAPSRFDEKLSVFNFHPENLKRFRAAVAAVQSGGTCHIAQVGDSITAATGATPDTSYPADLRSMLASLGRPTGQGQIWASNIVAHNDGRYSELGTVTNVLDGPFNASARVLASGASITYGRTPMDSVTIMWRKIAGGGNGVVTIDGVTVATLAGTASSTSAIQTQTINAPDGLGMHTIVITAAAGTFQFVALQPKSSNPGYVVSNLGRGSQTATNLQATPADVWPIVNADLVTIMLSANDFIQSLTPAVFQTKLTQCVQAVRAASSDVILMVSVPTAAPGDSVGYAAYLSKVYAVAMTEDTPLIDHSHKWVSAADGVTRGYYYDSPALHPNAKGYAQIANTIFAALNLPKSVALPVLTTGYKSDGNVLGTLVKSMPVYDANGARLGVVPIYDRITSTPVDRVVDTFTRANSTTLGTAETGQTWALMGTAPAGIRSNKAYSSAAAAHMFMVCDSGVSDGTVSGDFATVGATTPRSAIAFRKGGQLIGFAVKPDGVYYGANLITAFATANKFAAGDHCDIVLLSDSITIKKNGTTILTFTDAREMTETRHGIGFNFDIESEIDNFKVNG